MTYKELLSSVTFSEVKPYLVSHFDTNAANNLGWYKLHFDMLRQLPPKRHADASDDVCHISLYDDEDGTGAHLEAFPMEGEWWEHSLTKEIILDPGLTATNAQIAACCLWHTSFYGFTEAQVKENARTDAAACLGSKRWNSEVYYKTMARVRRQAIRQAGGTVPAFNRLAPSVKQWLLHRVKRDFYVGSGRLSKIKRHRLFRRALTEAYNERVASIGKFIVAALPALSCGYNTVGIDQLCQLFHSVAFKCTSVRSYASPAESGAKYLADLITDYHDVLHKSSSPIVLMTTGHDWTQPLRLTTDEQRLIEAIQANIDHPLTLLLAHNPALGHQIEITIAATGSTRLC